MRAAGLQESHGDRLEARHETSVILESRAGDDELRRRAALVHPPGVLHRRHQSNHGFLGGERAERDVEQDATLHAGFTVDPRAQIPSTGNRSDELERVRAVGVIDDLHGAREGAPRSLEGELNGVVAVQSQVAVLIGGF